LEVIYGKSRLLKVNKKDKNDANIPPLRI
jgi:hypothetical protein